jgi:putative membrane protein insertion efficiency factor
VSGAAGRAASLFLRVLAAPLLLLLWVYQRFISPALGPACRYYPSCSQYAVEAIRMRGPLVGPLLAIRRLLRCHPWAEGGLDPVPAPRRARRIPS